jgi:ABC-2 type transport system permease protein
MTARSLAVARHELRLLRSNPGTLVLIVVIPFVLIPFLGPALELSDRAGQDDPTGAAHVVPGMALVGALFLLGNAGFSFFYEYGWGTWDRLRVTPARPVEIVVGKMLPRVAIFVAQFSLVLVAGRLLFEFRVDGSIVALGLVVLASAPSVVVLGIALAALCRTFDQFSALSDLAVAALVTLGGVIAPVSLMPDWARPIAPLTPTYWTMRGIRRAVLGEGLGGAWPSLAALAVFTGLFTLVVLVCYRFDEAKTGRT